MNEYIILIKLLLLFQSLKFIIPKESNIIRVGGRYYPYIYFSNFDDPTMTIFGTSSENGKNKAKFYCLSKSNDCFTNKESFLTLPEKDINYNNITNYIGESFFIKLDNNICLLSISNDFKDLEIYDFNNNKVYNISTEEILNDTPYEFFINVDSFFSIFKLDDYDDTSFIFAFTGLYINLTVGDLYPAFSLKRCSIEMGINQTLECNLITINEIKNKTAISCFKTDTKIGCLYKNRTNELKIYIYDNNNNVDSIFGIFLHSIENTIENEDLFYKGIHYYSDFAVFLYYGDYSSNPIFTIKKFECNTAMCFVNPYITREILHTNDYNRKYSFNDLVKSFDDVYYASVSKNREKLYLVHFSLKNLTEIKLKYYSLELFKLYHQKFFTGIKLAMLNNDNLVMGYSHCNTITCEKGVIYYSSLYFFNKTGNNNIDALQNLNKTNKNTRLLIDFNIFKNNIFGYKLSSFYCGYNPDNLIFENPNDYETINMYENQTDITELYIPLPSLFQGQYYFECNIFYYDINSNNYPLRRRINEFTPKSYRDTIAYRIIVTKTLNDICNDLCSLCLNDEINQCISCKDGYELIGDDKLCFNGEGTISNSQLQDIYKKLLSSMDDQRNQIIKQDNAICQLSTIEEQKHNDIPYLSSVDLGQCESLLKTQEGLADEEDFLMVKVDLKNKDSSATYVQYEIYNPLSLELVSLDICDDITVSIKVPVDLPDETDSLYSNLEQMGHQLFNISDSFYNDICVTYTAENGADIGLKGRKEIIYDKNKNVFLFPKRL